MIKEFLHKDISLKYENEKSHLKMFRIEPIGTISKNKDTQSFPNFHLTTADEGYASSMKGCSCVCSSVENATCTNISENDNGIVLTYITDKNFEVVVNLEFINDANVIRQTNTVKNLSNTTYKLTHFSSSFIQGIAMGGLRSWNEDKKIKIHYCLSHWQGEAQWRSNSPEELGIYPQTKHSWDMSSHKFTSKGSWSTGKYYPLVMVEDTESGQIWYTEIEGAQNWDIEVGNKNGMNNGMLYIESNSCDEENGWTYDLAPNASYTAKSAVFGCTNGSFEEAVHELLIYKRLSSKANYTNGSTPAFFNDYMDCLWGNPSDKKLIPLIDSAAACGIEVFCIDAGWYKNETWEINEEKFNEMGLQGIFDYMIQKGIKPGIWLELEKTPLNSDLAKKEFLLQRNGEIVGGPNKNFVDFTNPTVRTKLRSVIDNLYSMGVRFIKNDYNNSTLIGVNINGSSPNEGNMITSCAFYDFIDEVKSAYPDLMIENCGSGAMRCDNGTLSHFDLQSTSDQECYYKNPSIAIGSSAYLAPEKAGIWSYPYPISYYENSSCDYVLASKEYNEKMLSGEQTVFNMINSLCGVLYLSGRIDKANKHNKALIKEGVSVYKKYREHTKNAFPIYPSGILNINDESYSSFGLISENKKKITLAVFRINTADEKISIDLSKWTNRSSKVKMIYPKDSMGVEFIFNQASKILTVKFPQNYSARFFEILN